MDTGRMYRFRGQQPPQNAQREPVRCELTAKNGGNTATIRLYDCIDSWGGEWGISAREFGQVLDTLGPSVNEIRLHINSPGGDTFEGIAILNQLRAHDAKFVAVVDGIAASAASFIAAGADETVMSSNSQMMIHDAWGLVIGNSAEMHKFADDVLDKVSQNVASIYAAKAGGDAQAWRAAMQAETWYTAEEAVAAGLADTVDASVETVQNHYDLSIFTHAGRESAPAPTPIPETTPAIESAVETAVETADTAAQAAVTAETTAETTADEPDRDALLKTIEQRRQFAWQ